MSHLVLNYQNRVLIDFFLYFVTYSRQLPPFHKPACAVYIQIWINYNVNLKLVRHLVNHHTVNHFEIFIINITFGNK